MAPSRHPGGRLVRIEADAFRQVVHGGALEMNGMPRWDDLLGEQQVDQIHAYIISVARAAYAGEQKATSTLKEGHL